MSHKLFIVESPAKAKKIQGYLGPEFKVVASVGHIRDLPKDEMGVSAPDHQPDYQVTSDKTKQGGYIRSLAKSASCVYLATDMDREGEAIAWHLQQVIGKHDYMRLRFASITKSAILESLKNTSKLDYPMFLAQQGRRVIDRYAGYMTGAALKQKTKKFIAAGRVQTPALRLIVEREIDIESFNSVEHHGVIANTKHNSENVWQMTWDHRAFIKDGDALIVDRHIPDLIIQSVTSAKVTQVTKKPAYRHPQSPLTTSKMQQAANNLFGMDASVVMRGAQKLYEAGLITYHRTDNPNLSDEAVGEINAFLRARGVDDCILEKPRTWKTPEGAQEAHEAVRPVDFNLAVADMADSFNDSERRLYQLILRAAIASQMKSAEYEATIIEAKAMQSVSGVDQDVVFLARGRRLVFDGWLRLMKSDPTEEKKEGDENQSLPAVGNGDEIVFDSLSVQTKNTKPPSRFTTASLIKTLEKEGIGRPATYASILEGLVKRDYVEVKKKQFLPTVGGRYLNSIMSDAFCFSDIAFTRELESKLDRLALGQADYKTLVQEFYDTLSTEISVFEMTELSEPVPVEEVVTYDCPSCKEGQLSLRSGKKGKFWGCSKYPDCSYVAENVRGKPREFYICPSCEKSHLRRIKGKKGFFWGCSDFANGCKASYQDKRGKPICD